jgi:hypothetical protein
MVTFYSFWSIFLCTMMGLGVQDKFWWESEEKPKQKAAAAHSHDHGAHDHSGHNHGPGGHKH